MNKEELLKIYSAYLPYKLKVMTMHRMIYTVYGITNKLYDNYGNLGILTNNGYLDLDPAWENKPILYDLSYLTKEIKHEGERFVPLEKLEELFIIPEDKCFLLPDAIKNLSDFYFTRDLTDTFRFQTIIEIYYKLIEWHFNIFGLPQDQFINKATLNK